VVVYNARWITIRWDESLKASWAEAKAYAEGEELRAGYNAMLELCRQKRNSRYLADARNLAPVSQTDQRWLNEEWFPQIMAAGVRFMAIVMPKSAVARLSARQILSTIDTITIVTNHFDDIEAARAWLRTV
jgi:hypothetical protein